MDERWETGSEMMRGPLNAKMHQRSFASVLLLGLAQAMTAQNGPVIPTGAMRNTMFKGQLAGLVALDTLAVPGMYGIGPVEFLRGEVLLLNGEVFRSTAHGDGTMLVEVAPPTKAPFFVHQNVRAWQQVELPDSVADLADLNAFLTARYPSLNEPFAFKLIGAFRSIDVHIVDVPQGAVVNGPDDAHRHKKHHRIQGREAEALGFFSVQHKGVFTHHDTNIHVHAITAERDWMGHVESMQFDPLLVKLFVASVQ